MLKKHILLQLMKIIRVTRYLYKRILMKNFKQTLVEWSIILLVACMSVFLVVNLTMKNEDRKVSEEIRKNFSTIQGLSNDIGVQQESIDEINRHLWDMDSSQAIYMQAIKDNTKWQQINYRQMQQLRSIYNEKINTAGSYNYSQIDSFFAEKYHK